jgi:hypothetical protein
VGRASVQTMDIAVGINPTGEMLGCPAVTLFSARLGKEKATDVSEKHARRSEPCVTRWSARHDIFEVVQRYMEVRRMKHGQAHLFESTVPGDALNVMDIDVILEHAKRAHLELRRWRLGMAWPWFDEAGDATGLQDARYLPQERVWIGDVVERMKTCDAIHALIGKWEPLAVKQHE